MTLEEYKEYLQKLAEPKEPEQVVKKKRPRKPAVRKVYSGKKSNHESRRF